MNHDILNNSKSNGFEYKNDSTMDSFDVGIDEGRVDRWLESWMVHCISKPIIEIKKLIRKVEDDKKLISTLQMTIEMLQEQLKEKNSTRVKKEQIDSEMEVETIQIITKMKHQETSHDVQATTTPKIVNSVIHDTPLIREESSSQHIKRIIPNHPQSSKDTLLDNDFFGESNPLCSEKLAYGPIDNDELDYIDRNKDKELLSTTTYVSSINDEPDFGTPTHYYTSEDFHRITDESRDNEEIDIPCSVDSLSCNEIIIADKVGLPGDRCYTSDYCSVNDCQEVAYKVAYKSVNDTDQNGKPGLRCKKHYHEICSIPGCRSIGTRLVKIMDDRGSPGPRCKKHYHKTCNVSGCTVVGYNLCKIIDAYGEPGPRCKKHLTQNCSAHNCTNRGYNRASTPDQHGPAGYRCRDHYYKICNIDDCNSIGYKTCRKIDRHGNPGPRCARHYFETCNVKDCDTVGFARVKDDDMHGKPGPRCNKHYRAHCAVEGCSTAGYRYTKDSDTYGPSGPRCHKHFFSSNKT